MDTSYNSHWADYLVFGIIMSITVAIGVLFATTGGKQRTTAEYFTGDRNMGVIPSALSIVVNVHVGHLGHWRAGRGVPVRRSVPAG